MRVSILVVCLAGGLLLVGGGIYLLRMPRPLAPVQQPTPAAAPRAAAPAAGVPADCLMPGPPPVPPDGGAASQADMKLAHDVIQAFVLHLEAYQACRNRQADRAGTNEDRKRVLIEQGNQAVDEAHALADAFAAQLKRFHAHHP